MRDLIHILGLTALIALVMVAAVATVWWSWGAMIDRSGNVTFPKDFGIRCQPASATTLEREAA